MRFFPVVICCLTTSLCSAQWDRTIEQIPEFDSLKDSTEELQRQIDSGTLVLERQHYRITKPLNIDLTRLGAFKGTSQRGATIIMHGAGPAIRVKGDHSGTASPKSFQAKTWNQRMPLLSGFEILGAHESADGIELDSTVGAIIRDVSVRWCRHGIHLVNRNRNVIVAECHLYENSGVGLFLDHVNLHQINVGGAHISYNRAGGIVVRDGNVRNLHVTGCDVEGNMPADETPTKTANILIDVSGSEGDTENSVAEISITGCTIQHSANYGAANDTTIAAGGANIRLAGKASYPINSVTISGNVLSDTSTNIDIQHAKDVIVSSNNFFAPKDDNLTVLDSKRVVVTGNTFNPRNFVRPGTIRFQGCSDCVFSSSTVHKHATDRGALLIQGCRGMLINGIQFTECGSAIRLTDTLQTTVANCRVTGSTSGLDVLIDDSNREILMNGNQFSGKKVLDASALVAAEE